MQTFNLVDSQRTRDDGSQIFYFYYIDKVEDGLTINSDCNYPCETCPEDNPE